MFLPDEIINLILSCREINPTAKLIRESVKNYNLSPQVKLNCFKFYLLKYYKKEKIINLLVNLFKNIDKTNIQELLNLNMIYQKKKKIYDETDMEIFLFDDLIEDLFYGKGFLIPRLL
jgi:hypothetical protein